MARAMNDLDTILAHFRRNQDKVVSIQSIFDEVNADGGVVQGDIEQLVSQKKIYKVGDGRYIFTTNADLVAFEIFRNIAPNITFDEYVRYKDETHMLMRMSRDREMLMGSSLDEELKESKTRGNPLK